MKAIPKGIAMPVKHRNIPKYNFHILLSQLLSPPKIAVKA